MLSLGPARGKIVQDVKALAAKPDPPEFDPQNLHKRQESTNSKSYPLTSANST